MLSGAKHLLFLLKTHKKQIPLPPRRDWNDRLEAFFSGLPSAGNRRTATEPFFSRLRRVGLDQPAHVGGRSLGTLVSIFNPDRLAIHLGQRVAEFVA
jgi:hypothetical protein